MADADDEKGHSPGPEPVIDERKVETAVKFLQNPKVQATPMSRRVTFLQQKGLSSAEIDAAISRSGSVEFTPDEQGAAMSSSPMVAPQRYHQENVRDTRPGWSNIIVTAILGGGVAYLLNSVVKRYIAPLLLGKDNQEELVRQLVQSVKLFEEKHLEMASSIQQSFQNIEGLLERQQIALNGMKFGASHGSDPVALSEIKSELTSMKSLLLARNQFPPSPFSQAGSVSAIPAWQKAAAMKKQGAQQEKQDSAEVKDLPNGNQDATSAVNGTEDKLPDDAPETNGDSHSETDTSIGENQTSDIAASLSSTFVKLET